MVSVHNPRVSKRFYIYISWSVSRFQWHLCGTLPRLYTCRNYRALCVFTLPIAAFDAIYIIGARWRLARHYTKSECICVCASFGQYCCPIRSSESTLLISNIACAAQKPWVLLWHPIYTCVWSVCVLSHGHPCCIGYYESLSPNSLLFPSWGNLQVQIRSRSCSNVCVVY